MPRPPHPSSFTPAQRTAADAYDALFDTLAAFEIGIATDKDVREAWAEYRRTRPPGSRWAIRHSTN